MGDEDAETIYNQTYAYDQTKLQETIFSKNYNRNSRPVKNDSTPVKVSVHMHVVHLSINQYEQTMTLHGHMYLSWIDELLGWDPKDFNGIQSTSVRRWQVWVPDVRVANSVSGIYQMYDISRNAHVLVQTKREGDQFKAKIETYPTFSIKVGCTLDYSDYPYDEHSCSVRIFTPKRMDQVQLEVYNSLDPTVLLSWGSEITKRVVSDFEVISVKNNITYFRVGDPDNSRPITAKEQARTWTILSTFVKFRRYSTTFGVACRLPLIIASAFSCLSMVTSKVNYGLYVNATTILMHIIFLHEFISILPSAIDGVPKCVWFYGVSICTALLCLLINSFFLVSEGNEDIKANMTDAYTKIRGYFPVQMSPDFIHSILVNIGPAQRRGWKMNVAIWRAQIAIFMTIVLSFLIIFVFLF